MALSAAHKSITVGFYPNHVIYIEGLEQDEVKNILASEKVKKTHDLKTAVLSFHQFPVVTCPYVILCGRPHSNNEAKNFNDTVAKACSEFCKKNIEVIFLNSAVNGVRVYAHFL